MPSITPVAKLDQLGADDKIPMLKVRGGPAQRTGLAPAEAGKGHDLEHGPEPVTGSVVQEGGQLLGLPRTHLRRADKR